MLCRWCARGDSGGPLEGWRPVASDRDCFYSCAAYGASPQAERTLSIVWRRAPSGDGAMQDAPVIGKASCTEYRVGVIGAWVSRGLRPFATLSRV